MIADPALRRIVSMLLYNGSVPRLLDVGADQLLVVLDIAMELHNLHMLINMGKTLSVGRQCKSPPKSPTPTLSIGRKSKALKRFTLMGSGMT